MDHQPLTGCRYTIVGDYHDLRTTPRILVEPIANQHPRGVDAGVLAAETMRLEGVLQGEIDEINRQREKNDGKNDWLGSQYHWDRQEQAWTWNPYHKPPELTRRPSRWDKKPDQDHSARKAKSDIEFREQEDKHPITARRVRTHEHPLHNHQRTDKHRPGHDHQAKHAHGHHHHQTHHRRHKQAHDREHQGPHEEHSRKQQNQGDKMQLVQPGLPTQALNQDYHPELDVLDKLFPDDKALQHNNPELDVLDELFPDDNDRQHKSPPRDNHAQPRRNASRPVVHRVHSSKGRLARHNPPRPQRPVLRRSEKYLGNNPKRDSKQQQQQQNPKHHAKKAVRFLPLLPHKGDNAMDGQPTATTYDQSKGSPVPDRHCDSEIPAKEDRKTPQHEDKTHSSHREAIQSPSPSGDPSLSTGKAPMPRSRRPTFIIGPDSHSSPSDPSTPRDDAAAGKGVGAEAADNPQPPSAADQKGKAEEESLDSLKQKLRLRMLAEANEEAVGSDDEESATDDERTPKARPLPTHMQRHQKQPRALPGPSSKTRAQRQEGVRKQLLDVIRANGGNATSVIQEEDEEEEDAVKETAPATCASKEGNQPSSLLTQSLMAERAQKADKAQKTREAAAAAAAPAVDAPGWLPEHKKQHHGKHNHRHRAAPPPKAPLTITTQLQPRDAAKRGLPEIITTVVHNVPAALEAQKQETRKSLQELSYYTSLGSQTGLPLWRIEKADDERQAEYDRRKKAEEEEQARQRGGQPTKKVAAAAAAAEAEEADFAAVAHASAHAAAVVGGADDSRPPRRGFYTGHYISDYLHDDLRSQSMPAHNWGIHW